MIEIIPNWHPIFVNFTVALFSTACALYVLTYLDSCFKIIPLKIISEFEIVARWCLWLVALITIGTVLAGFYAFNTVRHDEAAHIAMTIHRNWALATATGIVLAAVWSGWCYYKSKKITILFIIGLLVVQTLLFTTGWFGGELVFRHGLGVLSLPKDGGEGHHHHHDDGMEPLSDHSTMPPMDHHEQHEHTGM
jgi:uncharacterized membrane protein